MQKHRTLEQLMFWLPTLIWMTVIFSFSAQPALHVSPVSWQDFVLKKTAHFTEYFILALLFDHSLRHTTRFSQRNRLIFTIIFVVLYASSDELHQLFIATRDGRVRDVVIDILGGCTGLIFQRFFSNSKII